MDYIPSPKDISYIVLSKELLELTEEMARNVHEVWAAKRVEEGWSFGKKRDDIRKLHPCLISYDCLPEEEKEYDRRTAIETLKLIQSLGFEIKKYN